MSQIRESKRKSKDLELLTSVSKKQCASSSSGLTGAKLLEELRNDVKKREEEDKATASASLLEKQKQHDLKILNSLVGVSDALRSYFISSNRSVLRAADCYKNLAETLRCNKKDIKDAVVRLSEIIPEVLTIIPPDSLLNYRTIKLDFQKAYSDTRNTLVEHVRLKLAEAN